MDSPDNEFSARDVDMRTIGWNTNNEYGRHKLKSTAWAFVLLVLFIIILGFIIEFLSDGYLKHKHKLIGLGVTNLIIVIIYFKFIHKHVPFFKSNLTKSKFTGLAAIDRQRIALANQLIADARIDSNNKAPVIHDIEWYKRENKDLREQLDQANQLCYL